MILNIYAIFPLFTFINLRVKIKQDKVIFINSLKNSIKTYNILTITNKYNSMSQVITQEIDFKPTLFTQTHTTIPVRNRSPQH